MKRTLTLMSAGAILAAAGQATTPAPAPNPAQDTTSFYSLSRDLEIKGITSGEADLANPPKATFSFSGAPLIGRSDSQGLRIRCRSASGETESIEQGGMVFRKAQLRGSVWLRQQEIEGVSTEITSESLVLTDSGRTGKVTLNRKFKFVREEKGDKNLSVTLTAGKGSAEFNSFQAGGDFNTGLASGSVSITSAEKSDGVDKVSTITTEEATITRKETGFTVVLPKAFQVVQKDVVEGVSSTLDLSADSGSLQLGTDGATLGSATIAGSVVLKYTSHARNDEGKKLVSKVSFEAGRVVYSNGGTVLTVYDVKEAVYSRAVGDGQPNGFGGGPISKAVLTLSDAGEIIGFKIAPGTVVLSGGGSK